MASQESNSELQKLFKAVESTFRQPLSDQMKEVLRLQLELVNLENKRRAEREVGESISAYEALRRYSAFEIAAAGHSRENLKKIGLDGVYHSMIESFEQELGLELLQMVANGNSSQVSEMPLDENFNKVPRSFMGREAELREIFGQDQLTIEAMAVMARKNGMEAFLGVLQTPEQPLTRYSADEAASKMRLVPSFDGRAKIGLVDTKVMGVQVKYVYPNGQTQPIMSITSRPVQFA